MPLWWYLVAIGLAVLLGAEVHMGYPGVRSWIGYVVLIPLFSAALFRLGRVRVRVAGGRLEVAGRSVAVEHVGRTEIVARERKQEALGPELDPTAYLMLRSWVKPVVRVQITDSADPAPYWVFSVRDAKGLLTALRR